MPDPEPPPPHLALAPHAAGPLAPMVLDGRYRIAGEAARDDVLAVYRAEDLAAHRPVLVGVLHAGVTLAPEAVAAARHPAAPLLDIGAVDGIRYYVVADPP